MAPRKDEFRREGPPADLPRTQSMKVVYFHFFFSTHPQAKPALGSCKGKQRRKKTSLRDPNTHSLSKPDAFRGATGGGSGTGFLLLCLPFRPFGICFQDLFAVLDTPRPLLDTVCWLHSHLLCEKTRKAEPKRYFLKLLLAYHDPQSSCELKSHWVPPQRFARGFTLGPRSQCSKKAAF